jgi:hypothetical protein
VSATEEVARCDLESVADFFQRHCGMRLDLLGGQSRFTQHQESAIEKQPA